MQKIVCAKFRSQNFSLEDKNKTERQAEFEDELLAVSLKENPAVSVEELAMKLLSNCSSSSSTAWKGF